MKPSARVLGVALVVALALIALSAVVGVSLLRRHMHRELGGDAQHVLTISRGDTLKGTLLRLERQGVLRKARFVYLYARATSQTRLRSGQYLVLPQDTPQSLLTKLNEGRVRTEPFTVVEGHNRWLVRDALARGGWMSAAAFDELCDDRAFLARHEIPGPTCEGYLFPETYAFARGLAKEAIFKAMFSMFHRAYEAATTKGRGPLALEMRELVTLASIVEKETGAPEERPRIACVFYNRLQARPAWRLETDPTVIYAATLEDPRFNGNLKRAHLRDFPHPYNTYAVYGLPPGPIANPGRAALAAVAEPSTCDDFFFVASQGGRHVFCKTLDCHNAAVEKWQLRRRRSARP